MSSLFFMVTITDRRSTDAFLQLYESHGVDVSLRTVGSGTAVQETLSTLGLERTEKAVLMAVVTEETWQAARRDLRRKLRIDVPGTGIAFTVPLSSIGGKRALDVPHRTPDPKLEGGEHLEGYPLRAAAGHCESGLHRHHHGRRPGGRGRWRHGAPRQRAPAWRARQSFWAWSW